jgi:diguanylate cyclase (GGDEF)-like protein
MHHQEEAGDTAVLATAANKFSDLTGNCVLFRRDGPEIGIENSTVPTLDRDGKVTGMVSIFHDVGAARAKTLELSHLAQHDFLTDLPNRVLLNDRIAQAIAFAERYTKKLAVMFVDLDHFKKINDTYGHAVGDKLLQLVASRIVSCVRRSDTVSRQGGDEFIVLLAEVSHAEDSVFIARKILNALAAPYSIDEKHLCVSGSIGVSTYPGDGKDVETLIHKADTALYDAKKLGRSNYQFFRADMQLRVLEWKSLQGSLRGALGRNEFVLHYQPKIDLKTAEVSGVEALLRWNHPDRGLIAPAQFVPIAEESGLIVPIGQWVLLEACRQARAWLNAGLPPVRMAVNVSALQFMDEDFHSGVQEALMITGVQPHQLELELTETVLMHDADSAIETLNALKGVGVQLAVDDFGTGYSSFNYLRRFPLDCLKVDRSFIQELAADANNSAILSAMINLGKSLNHRVVAEGVETKEQLHFLQKQECSEGQGFYFCHPLIAEKFAEFLESGVREPAVH